MGREREVKAYLCTPLEVSRRRPIPVPPADCTAERPVDLGSDTDRPTGYGKREEIALSVQRGDLARDRITSLSSRVVLGQDASSDLDFLARWGTPVRVEPLATPRFGLSISAPGLLTSKERMTVRRGSDEISDRDGGLGCV